MTKSWTEVFDLGDTESSSDGPGREAEEPSGSGFFGRLRESLSASRKALSEEVSASLTDNLADADWERLEEALILADVGAATTAKVVGELETEVTGGRVAGADAVRERLIELLAGIAETGEMRIALRERPAVLMVCGVNGTGKTTTIGKIAWHLSNELGLSVVLAAATPSAPLPSSS